MRCIPNPIHLAILMVGLITFISVSGCTGNSPSSITPAATPTEVPGTMTVNIQNFAFVPASITVQKGTTVTWVNLDTSTHQIRNDIQGSLAQGALFSSDSLLKDARYSFKFDIPGTYPYYCTIHPSMKGTVIVT